MPTSEPVYVTSGFVCLTKPQLVGTMTGLLLAALLTAIDQTIVGTAEPRIIASLQGFDRYPWVATIYLLTSTASCAKTRSMRLRGLAVVEPQQAAESLRHFIWPVPITVLFGAMSSLPRLWCGRSS